MFIELSESKCTENHRSSSL